MLKKDTNMLRLLLPLVLMPSLAYGADTEYALTIKDHRFTPAELRVPANTRVKLVIENQDDTAEEFDSHDLNREKVIPPKSKAPVFIGPLAPGRYNYIGEFNEKTARGVIVAE